MSKYFELKNGLKVLLVESHKSPVISVQMWVKTGSADEKKGEEGLSHFIEHLVFKGTNKFKVGEIASEVEGAGGTLNAYTSFDETVFYVTVSSEFKNIALEVVSEMMGFPTFDPTEIDNEREVVIEEIKRGIDDPHRQASRGLFSTIYSAHPYGRPVIGYPEVVNTVTSETIKDYFKRRYVPENMTLVIVGNFEESEIREAVDQYFGSFENHKLVSVERDKEEEQKAPRKKIIAAEFEENLLHLAWPIPSVKDKDIAALELLSMILGQGESSRLMKSLRLEKSIAKYGIAGTFSSLDKGFINISSSFETDQMRTVLAEINHQLGFILSEYVSEEELNRVKLSYQSGEFYSSETVDGMAKQIGSYQMLFDDYKYHDKFMAQINETSVEDIFDVARKYLDSTKINAVFMGKDNSELAEKEIDQFIEDYKKVFKKSSEAKPNNSAMKGLRKIDYSTAEGDSALIKNDISNGSRLVFYHNHETPVLSLKLAIRGGLRAEKNRACVELLSRVWGSETESKKEEEIIKIMESSASSVHSFGGRNTVGMNLTTLSPYFKELYELYEELLTRPVFSDEIVEREKKLMINELRTRKDRAAEICILGLMQNMFEGHPYALDFYGTEKDIENITADKLQNYYSSILNSKNISACISGDIRNQDNILEKFTKMTESFDSDWEDRKLLSPYPKENKYCYKHSEKEQSHLVLAYPGLVFNDKDKYTLDVMQSVLAGQGGRLFMELRDKASLAYTVSPLRMDGVDAGYFGAYIGCSPDKVSKALEMMKIEFDKLMQTPLSAKELEQAQVSVIGRHDIALQRNASVAASIVFDDVYGTDYDECFKNSEHIRVVSAQDIQDLSQKIFKQMNVVSLVGPKELD